MQSSSLSAETTRVPLTICISTAHSVQTVIAALVPCGGKLACEMLMQNRDVATEELNRLKEIIDYKAVTKDWGSSFVYLIRLELQAARNIISGNLNGPSDPYAIIECGTQKRFSSMVPNSRNPVWGEEFDFYVEELPVQM